MVVVSFYCIQIKKKHYYVLQSTKRLLPLHYQNISKYEKVMVSFIMLVVLLFSHGKKLLFLDFIENYIIFCYKFQVVKNNLERFLNFDLSIS